MKNFKKALFCFGFLSCALVNGISFAQTNMNSNKAPKVPDATEALRPSSVFANKPQVVLFKIHDIKPLTNSDGTVTSCEYTATFYNRTPVSLRQAKIDFSWTDRVSEMFPLDGDLPIDEVSADQSKLDPKQEDLEAIHSSVDLPALGSLKQVSIRGVAETDKCFALFDNLKFRVSVCNILGQENNSDSRRSRVNPEKEQSDCASMFAYVNSKHPEYYGEFKAISYEEQVEQEKTQEEKEKDAISAINKTISTNIEKTNTIISNIK